MKGYESFSIGDLKLVYRVLHGQLTQQFELMDCAFFDGLQSYLQAEAAREGVDFCDHGAWDAWLGGKQVSCEVRMQNRFVMDLPASDSEQEEQS